LFLVPLFPGWLRSAFCPRARRRGRERAAQRAQDAVGLGDNGAGGEMFWCQIRCPGQSHAQSHATLGPGCLSWGEVVVAAALLGQAVSGRSEDKKVGLGETGRNPS
jgi:hypothetical protein